MKKDLEFLFSFLQSLTANLRHGVLAIDAVGRVRVINYFCGNVLKIKVEDALDSDINNISPYSKLLKTLNTQEKIFDHHAVINNTEVRLNTMPVIKDNEVLGAVEIWEDRTEVNNLSCKLKENMKNNRLMDNILNSAFENICAVDNEGMITYISENTARSLGMERKNLYNTMASNIRKDCLMEEVAKTGIPQMGTFHRHGNEKIPVMVLPIIEDEKVTGAVCKSLFRNIDEANKFANKFSSFLKESRQKKTANNNRDYKYEFDDIIGHSAEINSAKNLAMKAAGSNSTILILGESGTGKEMFAHSIHANSPRCNKPFVRVNCAGIPETLLESELFGYEAGAFTGARKNGKPGKLEQADGGTIFLDEIGDMSFSMQAKILRALQEGEIEKIGGTQPKTVDVRFIAATNCDLYQKVRKGEFREDLFYRLEVISLEIPPLRNRLEDLPILVEILLENLSSVSGKNVRNIDEQVMNIFKNYDWPGNIRELKNVLEGAVSLSNDEIIEVEDLPPHFSSKMPFHETLEWEKGNFKDNFHKEVSERYVLEAGNGDFLTQMMNSTEKDSILKALEITKGNKRQAANLLGISRSSIYNKLKKYNLA